MFQLSERKKRFLVPKNRFYVLESSLLSQNKERVQNITAGCAEHVKSILEAAKIALSCSDLNPLF